MNDHILDSEESMRAQGFTMISLWWQSTTHFNERCIRTFTKSLGVLEWTCLTTIIYVVDKQYGHSTCL